MNNFLIGILSLSAVVTFLSSCESAKNKKIKFYVYSKSMNIDWDENLYIDRIFDSEHYVDIDLLHNNPKHYIRHDISIGNLDKKWLLDSPVFPPMDISDSLFYTYYLIQSENQVSILERVTNSKYSYLRLEYSITGNLSLIQSHTQIHDSLGMVLKTTYQTSKKFLRNQVLDEHEYIFTSMNENR